MRDFEVAESNTDFMESGVRARIVPITMPKKITPTTAGCLIRRKRFPANTDPIKTTASMISACSALPSGIHSSFDCYVLIWDHTPQPHMRAGAIHHVSKRFG